MIRILIVDDHYLFSAGLSAIIQQEEDFEVIGLAGTVEEAVQAALTQKPDIILMDFNLPDGTGVNATQQIIQVYPDAKIVFLTMSESDDDILAAIRSGAVGYLVKNTNPARLVASLRAVQRGESVLSNAMTLLLMKELSRPSRPAPLANPLIDLLTEREKEIAVQLAGGKSNQEIAAALHISENTVKYHIHSLLQKLNLKDRKEIARFARENGLQA